MIVFNNVYKEYKNGVQALLDINFTIENQEFVFVVGASGAGKSTLVKLMIHEEQPSRGNIIINGKNITKIPPWQVPKLRRDIGVVFQDYRLLPKKTVWENVAFALEIIGEDRKTIRRRVPHVLELVQLADKAKSYPAELSGGESQRLSIARAIVNDPPILLCDEPTGNLDMDTAMTIMEILKRINNNGATVVMATHAREIVDAMNKRVLTLDNGRLVSDKEELVYETH